MGTETAQANTPTHGYAETREAAMAYSPRAVFAKSRIRQELAAGMS
jgi:hypothetical protein